MGLLVDSYGRESCFGLSLGLSEWGVEWRPVSTDGAGEPAIQPPTEGMSRRGPGGRQPGAGRKPSHAAVVCSDACCNR